MTATSLETTLHAKNRSWRSKPEPCTREAIQSLSLLEDDRAATVCRFAGANLDAIVDALEAPPADPDAAMRKHGFTLANAFENAANGKISIWRLKKPSLSLTVTDTFVSLAQSRDGGRTYFHLDNREIETFPTWLASDWKARAITAALAIAAILAGKAPRPA